MAADLCDSITGDGLQLAPQQFPKSLSLLCKTLIQQDLERGLSYFCSDRIAAVRAPMLPPPNCQHDLNAQQQFQGPAPVPELLTNK